MGVLASVPRFVAPPPGPFTPASLTGLKAWYDASDSSSYTIATGASQWNDKSGGGFHLLQATGASQPTLSVGGFGSSGKDCFVFDGTNDVMTTSGSLAPAQPFGVWIVTDWNAKTGDMCVWCGASGGNAQGKFNSANTSTSPIILRGIFNGASSQIAVSGGSVVNGNAGAGTMTNFKLGANRFDGELYDGKVAEIVITTSPTAGDITDIEGYLTTKWSI
jgi:hypothetical protein